MTLEGTTGAKSKGHMSINIVMGPFYPVPPVRGLAVEKLQYALAHEYASRGHRVTIISRRFAGFPNDEMETGVRHLRVPSFDPPRVGLIYRLLDIIYIGWVSLYLPVADVTVTNSVSAPVLLPRKKAGKIAVNVGRFPKGQMGLYGRADRFHAVSKYIADAIVEQSPGLASRVRVVHNAISHDFADAITAGRERRQYEVTYLGRVSREKGIDILIRAFTAVAHRHPDWRLSLIGPWEVSRGGDGDGYLAELRALTIGFEDRITFVGPVYAGNEIVERLKQSEVFVYPSIAETGEAFGVAPVEAMACGCAVIVSALEVFQDFVRDGENAVIFDHRQNPDKNLADSLETLMASPDLREKLGQHALRTATLFTPARIAETMLADLQELVGSASA